MSVNKNQPHLLLLPEDDANRQLANGFLKEVDGARQRQMQVLPVAGGWQEVLSLFKAVHVMEMERYHRRFMVLLIDFDGQEDRLGKAREVVPEDLQE